MENKGEDGCWFKDSRFYGLRKGRTHEKEGHQPMKKQFIGHRIM